MGDIRTSNFRNYHHPKINPGDYLGARVMLGSRYKLVVKDGKGGGDPKVELFDLKANPAESDDLAESNPHTVRAMQKDLRLWQDSVLQSLTGKDYRE